MADDEAAGKPSASRPGEKKSKAAKRPGEGPAPGASSSSMPPADARGLPPSGAARREAMGDDDVRSSTGSSQQPGRPKERVVRDTISIRSISPNPDGRLATSSSAAAIPASRPAPAPAAPAPAPARKSPQKKKVEDPDDDYDDYAGACIQQSPTVLLPSLTLCVCYAIDDFDEIDEEEEYTPPPKPKPAPAPAPAKPAPAPAAGAKAGAKAARQAPPEDAVDLSSLRCGAAAAWPRIEAFPRPASCRFFFTSDSCVAAWCHCTGGQWKRKTSRRCCANSSKKRCVRA